MGMGFRRAGLGASIGLVVLISALPSVAAGAQCKRPPNTSKVTPAVVKAFNCVVSEGQQLRTDVITQGRAAYDACQSEATSPTPKWQVVEEDGRSMVEFAQVTLPQISAEEGGLASYLGRFSRAYRGHELYLLQTAIREYNKAKSYTDAFAEAISRGGEALKSHNCNKEREEVQDSGSSATHRDTDASFAEKQARTALEELAG